MRENPEMHVLLLRKRKKFPAGQFWGAITPELPNTIYRLACSVGACSPTPLIGSNPAHNDFNISRFGAPHKESPTGP